MNLGNARFANAERGPNFFHGEFFVVVEREDALLLFWQFGNSLRQQMLHLRAETLEEWRFLGLRWEMIREVFFLTVAGRLDAQAAQFETIEFGEQRLQFAELDAHLVSDFVFAGRAAQLAREFEIGGVDETTLPAQFPRAPVEFAK